MTFLIANKDTYITSMKNDSHDLMIEEGGFLFHITSDRQTKYLEPREVALYSPNNDLGVCYGYEGDWDEFNP